MLDMTDRYAVSMYVDLRLGLIGGSDRIHTREEAYAKVARVYGRDAADYAAKVCD